MPPPRIIARLDVKGSNLIKGVQLEGLRVVGEPGAFAMRYYNEGIDEIVFIDAVASLYRRNNLKEIVKATASRVFIPLTVGGGIRSVGDVYEILRSGADKVAVNTAAVHDPELITRIARRFGAQCMVLQIDAKRRPSGGWEAYTDGGREHSGMDVVEWAQRGVSLGAGEILLSSVDRDGTQRGFDLNLVRAVASRVPVPVIASGGLGRPEHLRAVLNEGLADAVAVAAAFHFNSCTIAELKAAAEEIVYQRRDDECSSDNSGLRPWQHP